MTPPLPTSPSSLFAWPIETFFPAFPSPSYRPTNRTLTTLHRRRETKEDDGNDRSRKAADTGPRQRGERIEGAEGESERPRGGPSKWINGRGVLQDRRRGWDDLTIVASRRFSSYFCVFFLFSLYLFPDSPSSCFSRPHTTDVSRVSL